ncbi:hypothetical protein FRB91_002195 [Serendipita sp. 411]|nr:hypothetical protein FRB91_002195 [Serendipita sp. 411]
MLHSIPYEVLEFVFNLLDNKTLLDVCLVNHAFNNIASRSLYKTLIVNKKFGNRFQETSKDGRRKVTETFILNDAFIIFERRPELRLVVRNVVLHPSSVISSRFIATFLPINAGCYSQLATLQNVRKIIICDRFRQREIDSFWFTAGKLPSLETVVIEQLIRLMWRDLNLNAPNLEDLTRLHTLDLHLGWGALKLWATVHVAPRIKRLKLEYFPGLEGDTRLDSLSNLEDVTICKCPPDPISICTLLGGARNLTRVAISIQWNHPAQLAADLNAPGIGPINLTSLKINLEGHHDDEVEIALLYHLVRSLASHSRLRKLAILSPNSYPPYMSKKCTPLLTHILSHHGPTLHKLKLSFYNATQSMLLRILDQCTVLKGLCISLTPQTSVFLPLALARSSTLETIRLVGRGNWIYLYAGSLLSQVNLGYKSTTSLSCVKLCSVSEVPFVLFGHDLLYLVARH